MVDFKKLKSMSGRKSLDALSSELTKVAGGREARQADERFWAPTVDKAGNGYAVIRFLPAPDGEDVPFVRLFDHGFQGPSGTWYIENSLTTIGKNDPVSEHNSKLWNSGVESDKEIARKQKRRLHYISNIFVVQDPGKPENEGKVFLYKYGKKIFDKLKDAMQPDPAEGEDPINPFDLWDGTNFRLRIRQVEGYRNYDKSEVDKPCRPLHEDDDVLEKVWKTEHPLQPFLAPSNFKTYEELKTRLEQVLSGDPATKAKKAEDVDLPESRKEAPPKAKEVAPKKAAVTAPKTDEESDDTLEFFQKLAS